MLGCPVVKEVTPDMVGRSGYLVNLGNYSDPDERPWGPDMSVRLYECELGWIAGVSSGQVIVCFWQNTDYCTDVYGEYSHHAKLPLDEFVFFFLVACVV